MEEVHVAMVKGYYRRVRGKKDKISLGEMTSYKSLNFDYGLTLSNRLEYTPADITKLVLSWKVKTLSIFSHSTFTS